jgi:hypothetical protein
VLRQIVTIISSFLILLSGCNNDDALDKKSTNNKKAVVEDTSGNNQEKERNKYDLIELKRDYDEGHYVAVIYWGDYGLGLIEDQKYQNEALSIVKAASEKYAKKLLENGDPKAVYKNYIENHHYRLNYLSEDTKDKIFNVADQYIQSGVPIELLYLKDDQVIKAKSAREYVNGVNNYFESLLKNSINNPVPDVVTSGLNFYKHNINFISAKQRKQLASVIEDNIRKILAYNNYENIYLLSLELYEEEVREIGGEELLTSYYERLSSTLPSHLKEVEIGMSSNEVLEILGEPETINKITTSQGIEEQWVYKYKKMYIYFEDGIVTTIQESL